MWTQQLQIQRGDDGVERLVLFADRVPIDLVERLENKVHERARRIVGWPSNEATRLRLEEDIAPQATRECVDVELGVGMLGGVALCERAQRERPTVLSQE